MRPLVLMAMLLVENMGYGKAEAIQGSEVIALADLGMDLLSRSLPEDVARLMHYPPGYTNAEREADIANVGRSIQLLLKRFGSISNVKRETKPISFYMVTVSGGDVGYWQSVSPLKTFNVYYWVECSNLGTAVIKVVVFRPTSGTRLEIRSLEFGLAITRPGAKSQIISALKELMSQKGQSSQEP